MEPAKALGLTIPPSVLVIADKVIDRSTICWQLLTAAFGPLRHLVQCRRFHRIGERRSGIADTRNQSFVTRSVT